MVTQRAQLHHLRIAPRKVRLIARAIAGLSVEEAEARLLMSPHRAAGPLLKLLRSAIANAKQTKSLLPAKLIIREIRVDQGSMLKRFLPRAMGRATPLHKKSSHVTLILGEAADALPSRFRISVVKKIKRAPEKGKKEADRDKQKQEGRDARPVKEDAGFMKRMFRRKSV
ncbi:50S ribosomal protein L22 [Candidatus Wolfebacteria bacterium]|nr:50S ribosomal protein L22 [Candidatus Wolfebacteria bacterium]